MKSGILALAAAGLLTVACAPVGTGEPAPTPPDEGQCKAAQYQTYVGRNRSELPPRPSGEIWRVTCTTCPVTMDYNPTRLNFLFDEASGVIREVKCG